MQRQTLWHLSPSPLLPLDPSSHGNVGTRQACRWRRRVRPVPARRGAADGAGGGEGSDSPAQGRVRRM